MTDSQILELIDVTSKNLLSTDKRFRNSVTAIHVDGSVLHYQAAFAVRIEKYYVIYTEHHGYHVYPEDDMVKVIMSGTRLMIPTQTQ